MQETKETSSDQTSTVQEMTCRHQRKQHTRLLLRKFCRVFYPERLLADINKIKASECLLSRTTLADINKIEASECHSVPVL